MCRLTLAERAARKGIPLNENDQRPAEAADPDQRIGHITGRNVHAPGANSPWTTALHHWPCLAGFNRLTASSPRDGQNCEVPKIPAETREG